MGRWKRYLPAAWENPESRSRRHTRHVPKYLCARDIFSWPTDIENCLNKF